jgi:pimeloyl-ACP methyl ester carboxylesterase
MELNYRRPRIDPPSDPWDETFIDCFHPVDALLEPAANLQLDESDHGVGSYRLIPELRQAAQTMDPAQILARAGEAFFFAANLAETVLDARAATARGSAFADLAVSGRGAYNRFSGGVDLPQLKADVVALLNTHDPVPTITGEAVDAAVDAALDRAYAVAWALRGPPGQQAELRATLGWIAVSGEDDKPHRPVNVPPPPYEQYEVDVPTKWEQLRTRFFIASAVEPPARTATRQLRETPGGPPAPTVPDEHQVILFLHGHSSGAEEALGIIPALLKAGLDRGFKYSVLSVDLPNNGYSQSFDHLKWSPRTESTYPKDPADQTHINAPVLDFIEDFVVAFVDALPTSISSRLVAVIGGSLGGNLTLRLGRRHLTGKTWSIPAIVSWSPASVWPPKVAHLVDYMVPNSAFDMCGEDEQTETRDDFFFQSYVETHLLGAVHPQPDYWYRDGWVAKPFHVAQSKFARFEIYDKHFRQWHWRVAGEQMIYSHIDNEIFRDGHTPFRYEANFVRTLLVAGADDDTIGTHIYDNTIFLSEKMTVPGRRLLLNTTGHSIHFERPDYFAKEIVKFLNAQTWFITCVKRKDDQIQSYGVKMSTDVAEAPVQRSLDWCIGVIDQGDDVYALGADMSHAYVTIAHREPVGRMGDPGGVNKGYYLMTVGDDTTLNNIEQLGECQ